jgi:hypothetical protein
VLSRSAPCVSGLVGLALVSAFGTLAHAGAAPATFESLEGEALVADRLSLLTGPKGCWEVEADAIYAWESSEAGVTRGTHRFIGKLVDGAWKDVETWSLGDTQIGIRNDSTTVYAHGDRRFQPLLGVWQGDNAKLPGEADAIIAGLGADLRGKAVADDVTWDDARDAAVLQMVQSFGDGRSAATTGVAARFPNAGRVSDWIVAAIKGPIAYDSADGVRVDRAYIEVYGRVVDGQPFPNGEVVRLNLVDGREQIEVEQTLAYRHIRPCGLPTQREAKPLGTP